MRKRFWIASHVLALGVGLLWGGFSQRAERASQGAKALTKSNRALTRGVEMSEDQLWSALDSNREEALGRYERLKATLPVAANHELAVGSALARLPKFMDPVSGKFDKGLMSFEGVDFFHQLEGEEGERVAEFEVRVLHWLREDRDACLTFLNENFEVPMESHILRASVIVDYALESELSDIMPWMREHFKPSIEVLLQRKLKEGGGFEVLREAQAAGAPGLSIVRAFKSLPFSERDQVLDYVLNNEERRRMVDGVRDYLTSSSHPREEMVAWVRGVWDSERIPEEKRALISRLFGDFLQQAGTSGDEEWKQEFIAGYSELNPDARWEEGPPRQVHELLDNGRDYRFEFRHGRVSAEEVLQKLQAELSGDLEEEVIRRQVFHELVAESPGRALALVEELEENDKRTLLRAAGLFPFREENPEKFQAYLASLPGEWTAGESDRMLWAWAYHSDTNVSRYGYDYLDWIAKVPRGEDGNWQPESRSRFFLERHTTWRVKTSFPNLLGEWRERLEEKKR